MSRYAAVLREYRECPECNWAGDVDIYTPLWYSIRMNVVDYSRGTFICVGCGTDVETEVEEPV